MTLTFDVTDPQVTATLTKRAGVHLQFGTQADAEQFMILLGEAARLNCSLTLKLRKHVEAK